MSSFEELEKQFIEIKLMAYNGKSFPPYQGVNGKANDKKEVLGYSAVNEHFLQAMKYMYAKYDLKMINKDMAETEVEALRLKYISEKQAEDARARSHREFDEVRQKTGQITKELIDYEGKSQKEIFELIFCRLIPALTNEVAGKKIKEGAGYFLLTGENNFTDEEREELKARYA
ncbi:MAG: hypothetical protein IJO73_02475 [Clostridia bacterium]|nr:hypothetical protein [Clostridia bacterium]